MIKLLSFFIFIAGFIWTWSLFSSKSAIGIDVHAGIQSKLATLIQDTIRSKKPSSSNFQLNQIYTEKLDENKIKAYFTYQFMDLLEGTEKTEQTISGYAILNRGLSEDPAIQKWVIQSVKTNSSGLEFKEGLVISSEKSLPEGTTAPITSPKSEEKQTK